MLRFTTIECHCLFCLRRRRLRESRFRGMENKVARYFFSEIPYAMALNDDSVRYWCSFCLSKANQIDDRVECDVCETMIYCSELCPKERRAFSSVRMFGVRARKFVERELGRANVGAVGPGQCKFVVRFSERRGEGKNHNFNFS